MMCQHAQLMKILCIEIVNKMIKYPCRKFKVICKQEKNERETGKWQ